MEIKLPLIISLCFISFVLKAQEVPTYQVQDTALVRQNVEAAGGLFNEGKYKQAIDTLNKAKDILKLTIGLDHLKAFQVFNLMGYCHQASGDFPNAEKYWKQALAIKQRAPDGSITEVASLYVNLGIAKSRLNAIDEAISYLKRAENLVQSQPVEHLNLIINIYYFLGEFYYRKPDFSRAEASLEQLIELLISKNLEERYVGLDHYSLFGILAYDQGQYDRAIASYLKGYQLARKVFGEKHDIISNCLTNLGNAYNMKGQQDLAMQYHQKALAFAREMYGEEQGRTANSYNNIGSVYYDQKDFSKAFEFDTIALGIRLRILGQDHPAVASSYNNSANALVELKEYDKAIEWHKKALEIKILNHGHESAKTANSHYNLGYALNKAKKFTAARTAYDKGLVSLRYSVDASSVVEGGLPVLINLQTGMTEVLMNQYEETKKDSLLYALLKTQERFANTIQIQRAKLSRGTKSKLANRSHPQYGAAIDASLHLQELVAEKSLLYNAFSYAEKALSLGLFEGMQNQHALDFGGIPDSLLQLEYDLRTDLTYYEKRKFGLQSQGLSETDSVVLGTAKAIFDLKRSQEQLEHSFQSQYPAYYRLKYDNKVIDVNTVQKELLNPEETLLEYFVGDSSIYLFVIRQDRYEVTEVKHDFPLVQWVDSLRQSLSGNYRLGVKAYAEIGYKLYQKLVEPVADQLTDQLIIIPDGVLGYLPFEALLTGPVKRPTQFNTYPYLLQQKQISYCYSATLLKEMREKRHRREAAKGLLAFAPFYDGDTTLFANLFSKYSEEKTRDEGLEPLKYTGEEVYGISQLIPGDVFYDSTATEDKFVELAGDYRILHLATHGRANDKVGDYSFLAFTEIKDSIENELLYVRDLYNLQLNADLVVLSACETGIGELQRGEGIISLARGFTYAGAKSILTTLWRVNDERTKDLMLLFYEGLKEGLPKDEALRQAKLRFIKGFSGKNTRYAHPYFWSGLIAIGDMSEIDPR